MNLSPSSLIDQVWHEHILHTSKYREACTALGVFIDHDPAGAKEDDDKREKRLLITKTHYSLIFNYSPPPKFWDLKFEHCPLSNDDDDYIPIRKKKRLRGGCQRQIYGVEGIPPDEQRLIY